MSAPGERLDRPGAGNPRASLIDDVGLHARTASKPPRVPVPAKEYVLDDGTRAWVLRWEFRGVSDKQLETYEQGANGKQPVQAAAKLIAQGCGEIFIYDRSLPDDADDHYVPLRQADDDQDTPVRFDQRFARLWDLKGQLNPSGIVIAAYAQGAKPSDESWKAKIRAHAGLLRAWASNIDIDETSDEEVEDLAGEADASET